jgi:hypothetical protein
MDRNLCVSESVDDDIIRRAWGRLFWNNAIERIERRDSKKIIHLNAHFMEEDMDEYQLRDELDEILEIYDQLETEGTLTVCLLDESNEWWVYGRIGSPEYNNALHFDVCFE